MNPIAEKALARARRTDRQQATPKPRRDGACQPAEAAEQADHRPAPAAPARTPAEPPPRVDRVLFLEGQRAAKDLLRSMAASLSTKAGATAVLDRLRGIALGSPASYAAGVLAVVDQVETLLNRGEV